MVPTAATVQCIPRVTSVGPKIYSVVGEVVVDGEEVNTRNCAQDYGSGWWHNDCHCANLNGKYNENTRWVGFADSLKSIEMKLRARD